MALARWNKADTGRSQEGVGAALLTMAPVLLADLPVMAVSVFPLLDDPLDPHFPYTGAYHWRLLLPLLYVASALSLGLYWQRRYRRTARFVGIGLGLLPVLVIVGQVVVVWILSGPMGR